MSPRYGESSSENSSHEIQVRTLNEVELSFFFFFSSFFILFKQGSRPSPCLSMPEARMSYLKEKWDGGRGRETNIRCRSLIPKTWPPLLFLRAAICTFMRLLPETAQDRHSPPAVTAAAFNSFSAEPWVRIHAVGLQGGI